MAKRLFDILFSTLSMLLLFGVFIIFWFGSLLDTKSSGVFIQDRVGQYGNIFKIFKLRTIHPKTFKISSYGKFLRKFKFDELPQLLNIFIGDMSIVGPRPDVLGYYDQLSGENRLILKLKPGLTSEAAIKYSKEEELLAAQKDPKKYNDEIIFPDKVKLNLNYYYHHSILGDLKIIGKTGFVIF